MKNFVSLSAAVLCVLLFAGALHCFLNLEQSNYECKMTPEQRAEFARMVAQLEQVEEGTFVETDRGAVLVGPNTTRYAIWVLTRKGGGSVSWDPRDLARVTKRVVSPDDPDWPILAKKFLTE